MADNDPLEEYNDLSEREQDILEQELLRRAFDNSFNLLTKRKKMKDIVNMTHQVCLSLLL